MERLIDERFRLNHMGPRITVNRIRTHRSCWYPPWRLGCPRLPLPNGSGPSLYRPAAHRRNPPPFLRCKLNSRVHAPVLVSERSDHLGLLSHSSASPLVRAPELFRGPELGLLSILFALSAVAGSFFTLTIISFPAMNAFKRLKVSNEKLSKVVSEEVPGTLSSLRLSGMESNDLTSKLNNLRKILSGRQYRKKIKTDTRSSR